jgi:hypothetical protein
MIVTECRSGLFGVQVCFGSGGGGGNKSASRSQSNTTDISKTSGQVVVRDGKGDKGGWGSIYDHLKTISVTGTITASGKGLGGSISVESDCRSCHVGGGK